MAKVTDYTILENTAQAIVMQQDWTILEYMTQREVIRLMLILYSGNDTDKAQAVDVKDSISVIGFKNGVSVILRTERIAGKYLDSFAMCGYEDVFEDMTQIMLCIQTAIERMQYKQI